MEAETYPEEASTIDYVSTTTDESDMNPNDVDMALAQDKDPL